MKKEELFYQNLWKAFHKSIAIKERTNERLQMQHMPKKYWDNLIENGQVDTLIIYSGRLFYIFSIYS